MITLHFVVQLIYLNIIISLCLKIKNIHNKRPNNETLNFSDKDIR